MGYKTKLSDHQYETATTVGPDFDADVEDAAPAAEAHKKSKAHTKVVDADAEGVETK